MGVYYNVCWKWALDTDHSSLTSLLNPRPPVAISCFLRFYLSLYFTYDLRWRHLSLREERYRRKTRQRAPKPPFGFWLFYTGVWRGDVRRPYEFALVQLTRFRPVRRRAPVGSALGVPVVCALHGFAGKPGTAFFRQLVAESTASAGLLRTAPTTEGS